jgi:hypothetical protein
MFTWDSNEFDGDMVSYPRAIKMGARYFEIALIMQRSDS